ncbi:MAG: hypothetical protein ABEN55_20800 [Bradymonadaceae bacterium]
MVEGVDLHSGLRRERLIHAAMRQQRRKALEGMLLGKIAQSQLNEEGRDHIQEMLEEYLKTFGFGDERVENLDEKKEMLEREVQKTYTAYTPGED